MANTIDRAERLLDTVRRAALCLDAKEVMSLICAHLSHVLPFDALIYYMRFGDQLEPKFIGGSLASKFNSAPSLLGEGLSGWVAQNGRASLNGNATVEPNYCNSGDPIRALNAALSIPLLDLEGGVFGVLTFYSREYGAYSKEDLKVIQAIESLLTLAFRGAVLDTVEPPLSLKRTITETPKGTREVVVGA